MIDEFQYLFGERDAVTRQATQLLEDVARRGRSQGIHLVLASQDVSGHRGVLGPAGDLRAVRAADRRCRGPAGCSPSTTTPRCDLPRWHAVVNHESGIPHGNEIVRIPDATGRGSVDEVQRTLHEHVRRPAARSRGCSTAAGRRGSTT